MNDDQNQFRSIASFLSMLPDQAGARGATPLSPDNRRNIESFVNKSLPVGDVERLTRLLAENPLALQLLADELKVAETKGD